MLSLAFVAHGKLLALRCCEPRVSKRLYKEKKTKRRQACLSSLNSYAKAELSSQPRAQAPYSDIVRTVQTRIGVFAVGIPVQYPISPLATEYGEAGLVGLRIWKSELPLEQEPRLLRKHCKIEGGRPARPRCLRAPRVVHCAQSPDTALADRNATENAR